MREFKDKVAVITGAASGIGKALAKRCLLYGMKVVLADLEEKPLIQTEQEMKAIGGNVLAVLTDVSQAVEVEMLAQKTRDRFGEIHLLCNNAGVGVGGYIWECTLADWQWVMGVNLWGVIHGLRVFVPMMLEQNSEAHIINTASEAGLISTPGMGCYNVTKHGVVTLSETLHYELAQKNSLVKVSVLCPGFVNTRIMESERNRPTALQNPHDSLKPNPDLNWLLEAFQQAVRSGMSPEQVADEVFQGIRNEQFYIFTHLDFLPAVQTRMEDILQQRHPSELNWDELTS